MVVTVLAVTVFPFLYDGRVERAVASNLYTGLQAGRLATSGVVFAEALLKVDAEDSEGKRFDAYTETWAQFNDVPVAAGGGNIAMRITDESGKLNVNRLVGSDGKTINNQWRDILIKLLTRLEQDEQTARAMIETLADWIDTDDQPRSFNSAETSYYLGLDPPYAAADRPLLSLGELRAIKGWEPKVVAAAAPFLTTYGDGKVNFNTAPREVLVALELDESQADALIAAREKTPLKSVNDLRQAVPGQAENVAARGGYTSRFFSVTATATFRDSVAVVRAVLNRGQPGRIQREFWRAE
jgi:general secretion pathway protein K